MKGVQELALVLVDPLHVCVKHRERVNGHPVVLHEVLGKHLLVLLLSCIARKGEERDREEGRRRKR